MNPDSCVDRDCALNENPCVRSWQLCALAPIATMDHQHLLSAESASERLTDLRRFCCDRYSDLSRQLALDS
jgi:hypothetical protein